MNAVKVRILIAASVLVTTSGSLHGADVRLDGYRNPKNESFRAFNQLYLDGVKAGLLSYAAWLRKHGGQPAFCLPEDLTISTEQVEQIMLKSASHRSAKADMLIAPLLLAGLQDTYPCAAAR